MNRLFVLIIMVLTTLSMPLSAMADNHANFNPDQQKSIKKIVHDYIVNNPEVLVEATQVLQQRQQTQMINKAEAAIKKNATQLFDAKSPTVGNPNGSVTLVEFFDYQCIHCKQMTSIVANLLSANKDLKVIYKEFPIFGKTSEFAAKAAIAAMKQGKYKVFHDAMMKASSGLNQKAVLDIATKAGLNIEQLQKDMKDPAIKQELDANFNLARQLGIMGTPAFIIASKDQQKIFFVPGASQQDKLQAMINKAMTKKAMGA